MGVAQENVQRLEKEIERFDRHLIRFRQASLDFIDEPHFSQETEEVLITLRKEEKHLLKIQSCCEKLKEAYGGVFKKTAVELCQKTEVIESRIRGTRLQLVDDRDQCQKREEKLVGDKKSSLEKRGKDLIHKIAFITGTSYLTYQIGRIPPAKESYIALLVGAGIGTLLAFNNEIQNRIVRNISVRNERDGMMRPISYTNETKKDFSPH